MASPAAQPRIALAILVPEHDGVPLPPGVSAYPRARVLADPLGGLVPARAVTVAWTPPDDERAEVVELPWTDPDELYELVEALYVVDGWHAVDMMVGATERALVAEAFSLHAPPGLNKQVPRPSERASPAIHYLAAPTDPVFAVHSVTAAVQAIDGLPRVVSALRQVRQLRDAFSQDLPRAQAAGAAMATIDAMQLYAEVLHALISARADLVARVRGVLLRVERETARQISGMLVDARAEIVRETRRYFTFNTENGVEAALQALKTLDTAPSTAELQKAITALVPFADTVTKLDSLPHQHPTPRAMVEAALKRARAELAREVGRQAHVHPVIAQIGERDIRTAAFADANRLGDIIFPLLARAYRANAAMRRRVSRFTGMAQVAPTAERPELELAKVVLSSGVETSSWGFRKYVEKAAGRVAGDSDEVARRVIAFAQAELNATELRTVAAMTEATGQMIALGAAAQFAKKLVPVVNMAAAGWHITVAVKEYTSRHDEFYCTLDPRTALVETAPSTAGLALDIATEVAFAVV